MEDIAMSRLGASFLLLLVFTSCSADLTLGHEVVHDAIEYCSGREGLDALHGEIRPQGDILHVRCKNGEGYLLEENPQG
jgi:hypothetical protein